MTKLYLRLLTVLTLAVPAASAFAQDAAFSQYYNTPFQTNPAMLSFRPDMVIGANFRSQWSGLGVPYTSFLLSGYYPILSKNKLQQFGSAGGYILNDRQPAGKVNTLGFGVAGAYKLPVNYANYFHFGIQLGYIGRSISDDGLTTGNQVNPNSNYFDPSRPNGENLNTSRAGATIGLGTSWVNEDVDGDFRAQLGVAAYHVNAPNISFQNSIDNLYRKFIVTGSVRALKAPGVSIYPGARYILQGPAHKLNVGALARFAVGGAQNPYGGGGRSSGAIQPGNIGFGLYYQTNDASAIIGVIEIVQPKYAISFNYDFGMGSLKDGTARGNASEIFIAYRKTLGKRRKVDLRYFNTDKNSDGGTAPGGGADIPDAPRTELAPAPDPVPPPAPVPTPAPTPAAPAPAPKTAVEAATKLNTTSQTKKTAATVKKAASGKNSKGKKGKKGKAKTTKKKVVKKKK